MKAFKAQAIVKSRRTDEAIEFTFAGPSGTTRTLSIRLDLAETLAQVFSEAARETGPSRIAPTKLPNSFAVGSGKHEDMVLVRFEQDVPYGLTAEDASALGEALIEQSEALMDREPMLLQ